MPAEAETTIFQNFCISSKKLWKLLYDLQFPRSFLLVVYHMILTVEVLQKIKWSPQILIVNTNCRIISTKTSCWFFSYNHCIYSIYSTAKKLFSIKKVHKSKEIFSLVKFCNISLRSIFSSILKTDSRFWLYHFEKKNWTISYSIFFVLFEIIPFSTEKIENFTFRTWKTELIKLAFLKLALE